VTSRQTKTDWGILGLASGFIVALSAIVVSAEVRIVSPPSLANVEGDGNAADTGGPGRIQYLFPASDFLALSPSQRWLVSWNFRGDASQTTPVDWTFNNAKLWMSTTDKDSLTNVFDDNHGPDKTLVIDGTVTYPILASGPAEGPRDFANGTPLQTPFYYDPSKGNLLIEEIALTNSVPFPGPHLDFQSSTEARVLFGSANSTTGSQLTGILIGQFTFASTSFPGDFNNDGTVDAADYVVWRKKLGTTYTQSDYDAWRANFGKTAGSGAALPSAEPLPAVPEPSSELLIMLAIGFILSRARNAKMSNLNSKQWIKNRASC
jgi:hypothetical protein